MKPEPQETEKNLSKDLSKFEHLPLKDQEMHLLADEAEKSTGKDREVIDRLIQKKSE